MTSVLVGMSGGVDSSVAAALLQQQGYRVIGGFIKNWSDSKDLWTGECAWRTERRDALRVASRLNIPLLTFDFEQIYRTQVVDELFRGYAHGQTPNPDVLCNEAIKFGVFAKEGERLGIEAIATGHYARVERAQDASTELWRGADPEKDQSYFLYRVPQSILRRTLFPLGSLTKAEVRTLARTHALPVADKPDSQGICFIGKLDMAEFLRKKIPSRPGDIVDEHRQKIGRHEGLDAYTIGQRHRIHVSRGPEAWYVAAKNLERNELLVVQGADHPWLSTRHMKITDVRWMKGSQPVLPCTCEIQVRYRQTPVQAEIRGSGPVLTVRFSAPVKAVAPGQSAVFYQGQCCLGGGVILEGNTLEWNNEAKTAMAS